MQRYLGPYPVKMRVQVFQILAAAVILAVGPAVYPFDRPTNYIFFIPDCRSAAGGPLFGSLSARLPGFAHLFCFILIAAALLAPRRLRLVPIGLLWFGMASLFELARHDASAARIAEHVPGRFQDVILLENTADYFLTATFDLIGILTIAAGIAAAYIVLQPFGLQEYEHDN